MICVIIHPMQHEVYEDEIGVLEYDVSAPVLVLTSSGDFIVARLACEFGNQYWYDADTGERCDVKCWMPDPRKTVEVIRGGERHG